MTLTIAIAILFLLVLGPLYKWGLERWFRKTFRFDLGAVFGIVAIVSAAALIQDYYNREWSQFYIDIVILFVFALPSMTRFTNTLIRDRQDLEKQLRYAQSDIITLTAKLEAQELEREKMMTKIREVMADQRMDYQDMFMAAMEIISLRKEAEAILKDRRN